MNTLLFRRRSLLLILMLLALAVPNLASATNDVNPTSVRPGERVNFSADGFTPRERVDFWVTDPASKSYPRFPAVVADSQGAVLWSWDVPADAAGGTWTGVSRGVRSEHQVSANFTVVAPQTPVREVSVTPPNGPAGTVFHFTVAGLTPGEGFGPWVRGPDGRDRDIGRSGSFIRVEVGADGRLAWDWTAPAAIPVGAWRSLAKGETSGIIVEVSFTITGEGPPAPELRVEPVVGAPGTTFSFVVGGFQPGEVGGSWFNTPSGDRVDGTPYLKVNGAGVAYWTWTAPKDAQAGRWQAVTRGEKSRREVVLDLTISGSYLAPIPVPGPVGSVVPATGLPESKFYFTVTGFEQGERELAYWFTDGKGNPVRAFEKVGVDSAGHATWVWTTPRLAEAGAWIMIARGKYTGREVQVPFTVVVPDPPTATVNPLSGPAGTSFNFRATGLNVIERLDTWVERPDGKVVIGTYGARANGQGIAVWTWTAPADAIPGTWIMVIKGRDTNLIFRVSFTLTK